MVKTDDRVTRDEIEAKFGQIRSRLEAERQAAQPRIVVFGVAGVVVVVVLAFLLGRRRGHRRSTVVEIRRV